MRLLIVNPNTSTTVTDRIREAANAAALPSDRFTTLRPTVGPELIVTEADADLASIAVLDTVMAHDAPYDGIVLASFGNTGAKAVQAARPGIPVIGIATAAFSVADDLGGPVGIVTFAKSMVPGLEQKAEEAGLGSKLIGTLAMEVEDFGDPGTVQMRYADELGRLCNDMGARGASCVVMGGGPLAGLAAKLAPSSRLPIIDGTQSAVSIIRAKIAAKTHQHAGD